MAIVLIALRNNNLIRPRFLKQPCGRIIMVLSLFTFKKQGARAKGAPCPGYAEVVMGNKGFESTGKVAAVRDNRSGEPALSAIVVIPDRYETVRYTMSRLQAQSAAEQIEVVFVTPSYQQLALDESRFKCFHSWQVVEVGTVTFKARAFAAGIRHARAPVVALTEDHSFPDARWAEVFIAAHRQPWAAVGPAMCNGNPDTMLSWADFYQAYGEWTPPVSSGPVSQLAGHNSSYKRDILLALGDRLDFMMEAEGSLHRELKAQGYKLMLESGTCTTHLNFASWSSWLPKRYYTGRQVSSTWAKEWPWRRRLLFTAASPLIPWVRLWRVGRRIRRGQPCVFLMRMIPVLLVGLLVEGIGYTMGYAAGPGSSIEKAEKYEYHRVSDTRSVNDSK